MNVENSYLKVDNCLILCINFRLHFVSNHSFGSILPAYIPADISLNNWPRTIILPPKWRLSSRDYEYFRTFSGWNHADGALTYAPIIYITKC